MKTGVLWLCDKKLTLAQNIEAAVKHMWENRGQHANYCEANIGMATDDPQPIETVFVRNIQSNHIWIGTANKL